VDIFLHKNISKCTFQPTLFVGQENIEGDIKCCFSVKIHSKVYLHSFTMQRTLFVVVYFNGLLLQIKSL